jgi:Holliday junction DNA helicase RuvB
VYRLDFYDLPSIEAIIRRSAKVLKVEVEEGGVKEIACRSRGTPRVANRLLKRLRDFAQVKAQGIITEEVAKEALHRIEIDHKGLDEMDIKLLQTIIHKFDGGPVGLETLAAAIGEEADTIMDIYEPYLLQLGFIERTPRGRLATRLAYQHLGLPYKRETQPALW